MIGHDLCDQQTLTVTMFERDVCLTSRKRLKCADVVHVNSNPDIIAILDVQVLLCQ